jgi:outer membrane protein TolC
MLRKGFLGAAAAMVVCVAAHVALAQTPPPSPGPLDLTIDEALRLGEARSERVLAAQAGLARSRALVVGARSQYFPQIGGSAGYERTLKSEFDAIFDSTDMSPGGAVFEDLPFGRKHAYRVGLGGSQNVFTGGRIGAQVDLAQSGKVQAELGVEQSRALAVLAAADAYYQVILSARLVYIAERALEEAEKTLKDTQLGFSQGSRPEYDVLRAEVSRDNQRMLLVQLRALHEVDVAQLQTILELDTRRPLRLVSDLENPDSEGVDAVARRIARVPPGAEKQPRAPVDLATENVRSRQAETRVARSQWFPTIQLGSNLGWVTYPTDGVPGTDDWRTNWTVDLTLTVPIFTGGRIESEVRASEANTAAAQASLQETRETADLEVIQARVAVETARAQWRSTERTVTQARRAYEIAVLRFNQGISTQVELVDARVLLEVALGDRAQAAKDLRVSRIRQALLPKLPLTTTPGGPVPLGTVAPSAASPGLTGGADAAVTSQGGGLTTGGTTVESVPRPAGSPTVVSPTGAGTLLPGVP